MIEPALVEHLKAAAGPGGWLTDADAAAPYVRDPRGLLHGRTPIVLRPSATDQVSAIVKLCAAHGVGMVPQGGNTSYMGAATPDDSGEQVVISLARMNHVREVDAANYTLTAEAGCVLAAVQAAAAEADLLFPLSMGSEGSCCIGGNLSTNAGGTAVLRYGNTRDLALGLEVVLPDGRVWNGLRRLRKNNTGYDFRHLFIGAEGTLGIITAAVLKLFPRPAHVAAAVVALPGLEQAVALLGHLRRYSGDLVSAFEYMHGSALELVAAHLPDRRVPLSGHRHTALVELSGGAPGDDLDRMLESALAAAFEAGLAEDAVIAASLSQRGEFWRVRESIPEAQAREGECILCDVSVPVSAVPDFVRAAEKMLPGLCPGIRVSPFGHVGDGNIHLDLIQPANASREDFRARTLEITRAVHDLVHQFEGSFSAEHGIGTLKLDDMRRYRAAVDLDMLRSVKWALDPYDLMNPGKLVPRSGE